MKTISSLLAIIIFGFLSAFGKGNLYRLPAPAAPSSLTATTVSSAQINLAWVDNSTDETGFQIERSSTSATAGFTLLVTTAANATSYSSTSLTAGTVYYYRIRATNASGMSSYTTVASATTTPTVPSAPSALSVVPASGTQINLSWIDNSNNESGFQIERSQTSSTSGFTLVFTTAVNARTWSNTGLTTGVTYYYRIRATNTGGNSAYTAVALVAIPTAPTAPGCLVVTVVSSSSVKLSWTDNVASEKGFQIERSQTSASTGFTLIHTTAANVTSYTDTNLAPGVTYYYRIRAVNTSGTSAYTTAGSVGTLSTLQNQVEKYAFQYKYDDRQRLVAKKIPGAEWVYMVYDDRDRLVLTQDGNQRAKYGSSCSGGSSEWTFTKYDALNRPIMTGIYLDNTGRSRETMQQDVNNFYIAAATNADEWFEIRGTTTHGYSNQSFPKITDENQYYTITYYDDDSYKTLIKNSSNTTDTRFNYKHDEYPNQYKYNGGTTAFPKMKGLIAATKTRIVGKNEYLWNVNHYDEEYRIVQTVSTNAKKEIDRTTTIYGFSGKVLESKTVFNVGASAQQIIAHRYEYDHANRPTNNWHQVNANGWVLLSSTQYNELGEIVTEKLHSTNGSSFKQQIDFRYNIRGWMTRMNNADLNTSDGGPKDFFGIEFGYNNDLGIGKFTPQYNGNISATKWSAGLGLGMSLWKEPTERGYRYQYDRMNRLVSADHASKSASWIPVYENKERISYDLNGNIMSMLRTDGDGRLMDNLRYSYGVGDNKSNRLLSVTDYGQKTTGFKDDNVTNDDYTYDANGNLVQDKNKKIQSIKYNSYLNLNEEFVKDEDEKIRYIYDAEGIRLSEEIYLPGSTTPKKRTDYVGPLVYENDTLKFILHDDGKVIVPKISAQGLEYQYQMKDHLGNVRLTFTTKTLTESIIATMEDTGLADESNPRVREMRNFGNLFETEIRNVSQWLNHTSAASGNAIYLDGSAAKTIGPNTMMKVYPGDTVRMEVFAKFEKKASHASMPVATLIAALIAPVQNAAIPFDGGAGIAAEKLPAGAGVFLSGKNGSSQTPSAYLNYILFDKNFEVVDLGYDLISDAAGFNPAAENTVAFDKMSLTRIIDRIGYIYVYVSNESPGTRVWMDDLKITCTKSPIVQFEDYYPFGLSIAETAYERGNDQYKGMVTTDGTGLKELGFRQYDPALGRFHAVDPLAENQFDQSAYQYAGNDPVNQIDVLGLDPLKKIKQLIEKIKEKLRAKLGKARRKQHHETTMVNAKRVKVANGNEPPKDKHKKTGKRVERKKEKEKKKKEKERSRSHQPTPETRKPEPVKNPTPGGKDERPQLVPDDVKEKLLTYVRESKDNKTMDGEKASRPDTEPDNHPMQHRRPRYEGSSVPDNARVASGGTDSPSPSGAEATSSGNDVIAQEKAREQLYSSRPVIEARAVQQRQLYSRSKQDATQPNPVTQNVNAINNNGQANGTMVWNKRPAIYVEYPDGGTEVNHEGAQGIIRAVTVALTKDREMNTYTVAEVMIGDGEITPDDNEVQQAHDKGMEFLQQQLEGHTFASEEAVKEAILSLEDELEEYMQDLLDGAQSGDVKDYLGIDPAEKAKLQASIDKFRNEQGINSEVFIFDKNTFEKQKEDYENGLRVPDKDVTVLLTRDEEGNIEKHFVYKEGFMAVPTQKTLPDGTVINLEGTPEEVAAIRDQHIDKAIENDDLEGVDIDPGVEPNLNVFEKGMWVVKVTKELLDDVKVPEGLWHTPDDPNARQFPFTINPTVAGVGDGLIDEVKSIPDLVIFGLSMFDKEERDKLVTFVTNLDMGTIKTIFKEKVDKYTEMGPQVAGHEVGYDGVQIASMFWGGGFTKGAKAVSTAGDVGSLVKKVDGVLDRLAATISGDLQKLSGKTQAKILKELEVDPKLLQALQDNPVFAKAWTQHKQVVDQADLDKATEALGTLDDATRAKVTNLIEDSQKKALFTGLMQRARDFDIKTVAGRVLAKFGNKPKATQVTLIVTKTDGKKVTIVADHFVEDNGVYRIIDAKYTEKSGAFDVNASFTPNQKEVVDALKSNPSKVVNIEVRADNSKLVPFKKLEQGTKLTPDKVKVDVYRSTPGNPTQIAEEISVY